MANLRIIDWTANFIAGLRVPTGAGSGKIATSDSEGNVSWASQELSWESVESLTTNLTLLGSPWGEHIQVALAPNGIVYMRGTATVKTEMTGSGVLLFIVPSASRPEKQQLIMCSTESGTATLSLLIKTNGEVVSLGVIKKSYEKIGFSNTLFSKKG
jgi:hypothetical protein